MKKEAKLKRAYERIPDVKCKGLCHEACAFIMMSRFEKKKLDDKYGSCDYLANPCPKLTIDKQCSIYNDRPWVCRMFGTTELLKCPFGCRPETYVTDKTALAIKNQVDKL